MAGNSVIGSLRVDLGLNSAQFTKGMKDASSGLKIFGVQLTYSLNGIAYQLGRLIGAFPSAIKGAIDHADALNKSAQKAGVTVEALSRLEYAAKLSDLSLEDLTGGLGKLSKAMAEATITKTSTAATAFKALGVAVTDSAGKLRSSTSVLGDIADRFARLPDGATKTALALQIFGKSGAELIPLLNQGSAAIAKMADESDRLGITISGKTAGAAEKFNDTLTKIGAIMDGVVNQVTVAALPALQSLADTLSSPAFAEAAAALGVGLVNAINLVANAFENAWNWGNKFASLAGSLNPVGQVGAGEDALIKRLGLTRLPAVQGALSLAGGALSNSVTGHGGNTDNFLVPKFTSATKALKNWNDEIDGTVKRNQELAASIRDGVTGAVQGFTDAIIRGTDPLKAFADQLMQVGSQLLSGGISSFFSNIFTPNFLGGTLGAPALKLGFQTGVPGFASGTGSAPAGMAWVGENGPELVNFRGGEQVIPNSAIGGQSTVRIDLGPGLVASILEQSKQQSIQIVRTGAPAAVAAAQRNRIGG
jgi:hypothetical protein